MEGRDINLEGSRVPPSDRIIKSVESIQVAENTSVPYFLFAKHTMFIGLKYMQPEDILWRRDNPSVPAMVCLQESGSCSCPYQCITQLARRVGTLFSRLPFLKQMFIMFKRPEERNLRRHDLTFEESQTAIRQDLNNVRRRLGLPTGRRTNLPRFMAIHITSDYSAFRLLRLNYDALQYILANSDKQDVVVGSIF